MKGLIVAAGYGTRFLPFSKSVPKELIPLIDRPALDFIIEEFVKSGIKDIIVISSRRKKALEDYFDREPEMEELFRREGSESKLKKILPPDVKVCFIRQREMRGTGHALLQAAPFIGNSPVVVAYPDDVHFGDKPLAAQLIDTYRETGCSVLATVYDPPELYSYAALKIADDKLHVLDMVEKPAPGKAPSKEASVGRYLYTPEYFGHLQQGWEEHQKGPDAHREYYHVYGLKKQMEHNGVVYKSVEGTRVDTGNPEGYIKALVRYAATNPEWFKVLREEVEAAGRK
ncbi:MAG: UTP--glucose-1-phosphate uridylyltransferase [Spirochaetales bacterium]|nr:UTP--glucose-1-phosphate uridylyltransferase [Spirochaetales bacterium]